MSSTDVIVVGAGPTGLLGTRYPMILIVPQSGTEQLLMERARGLGVDIVEDAEVVGLREDADEVVVELADGGTAAARHPASRTRSAVERWCGSTAFGRSGVDA